MKKHRNSQKRIVIDDGVFAITTVTKDRYPYFREKIFGDLFIEQLRLCKQIRGFRLYGFCLMPDHLHIILQPKEGDTISKVMHFLKRHVSRDLNVIMGYYKNPHDRHECDFIHPIPRGEVIEPRLRKNFDYPHPPTEGGDRYPRHSTIDIEYYHHRFLSTYPLSHPFPPFSWQSSFHDHLIRDDRDLKNQLGYLWINPEKDGLIQNYTNYLYSSYGFHHDLIDV